MSENFLSRQSQKKQEEIDFYNRSLRGGTQKKGNVRNPTTENRLVRNLQGPPPQPNQPNPQVHLQHR